MILPHHEATLTQLAVLLTTRLSIRSISFPAPAPAPAPPPGCEDCRDPCTLSERAAAEVTISPVALAASVRTLEARAWECR